MRGLAQGAVWMLLMAAGPMMGQSSGDKSFLAKSSQGNVTEVELSKLALRKSSNASVRSFAERMIKDHQTLGKKMSPFLVEAGVKPSVSLNTEHQHLFSKLNALSGAEFDKAFVEAMDKDHNEDLADFDKEINETKMTSLKVAVVEGQKVIKEHTQMIDDLSRQMGMQPAGS